MTTTNTINPEFSDYLSNHYKRLDTRKEQAIHALRLIFVYAQQKYPALGSIEITYEGSGDSGFTDGVRFCQRQWQTHPNVSEPYLLIDDEIMPDELCFDRKSTKGHWDPDRSEWICDTPDANPTIQSVVEDLAWDIAYGQHPGFEINEGGFGTIVISGDGPNPDDINVKLSHSERVETTNDYEYQF